MSTRTDRRLLAVALIAVAISVAACGSGTDATPSPSTAVASATASVAVLPSASADGTSSPSAAASAQGGGEGEETSVFDLEVGDCFTASGGQQVESVLVVDCERPHVYEVFSVFDHGAGEDDPYPGDEEMQAFADDECQPEFEAFVGSDYESSRWYITSVTPSEDTWADGDREIVCTLNLEDTSEVTGTAEGAGD